MPQQTAKESPDPRDVLREYVAKNGLKFTKQRELIADVFFTSEGHLKVEELLEKVRKQDEQVSLATVYRTMKLLTDCGLAHPHRFGERQTVYESMESDDEHHDHIICNQCGRIVEFVDDRIEVLQEQIATQNGFKLTHHRMELYGLCIDPKCEKKD
ncbi:MAG: transcriptional repressor [Myxococcota bacterium]